ncbi:MAG: hypothetical protein KC645_10065 [Gemmatimonadetes bacterium]|nr:hypothetical protein [Gemmatimonadota bacterium]
MSSETLRGWTHGLALIGLIAFTLYAVLAGVVFGAAALHVDEMVQTFQAHIFASGRLALPTPAHPEFSSSLLVVDAEGRRYAQFPPGGAALLALGELLGAAWLIGPLFGAVTAVGTGVLARVLGESRGRSLAAAALLATFPWFAFNAATRMNHVPTAALLVVAVSLALAGLRTPVPAGRSRLLACLAGVAFGLAAAIRPLDAAAFAAPFAVWHALRFARGSDERGAAVAFAAGLLLGGAPLLLYNTMQHGGPFTFGYTVQWGPSHGLGVHEAPWGPPHTVGRGLLYLNHYLLDLQTVLLETGAPALLFALLAILLAPPLAPADRAVGCGALLLLLGYFAYWHDGSYLGPRFLLPLAPVLALWIVRLPRILGILRGRSRRLEWAGAAAIVAVLVQGWVVGVPARAREYRAAYALRRLDVPAAVTAADARDAVVLVPASWGSQVLARLWGLGVSHKDAQWLFERADLCRLDHGITQLEHAPGGGPADPFAVLLPLADDSLRLGPSTLSADTTQRMLRGATYPPACVARARFERSGTLSLLPFLASWEPDGPLFVRDLHERDRVLIADHPDRRFLVARPSGASPHGFTLSPLDFDSAGVVWASWEAAVR